MWCPTVINTDELCVFIIRNEKVEGSTPFTGTNRFKVVKFKVIKQSKYKASHFGWPFAFLAQSSSPFAACFSGVFSFLIKIKND